MKFQEILELIDKIAERGIASVEIEQSGTKVKIEGKSSQPRVFHVGEMMSESASPLALLPAAPQPTKAEEKALKEQAERLEEARNTWLMLQE